MTEPMRESPKDVEAAWLEEAQKRYEELRSGTVKPVPVVETLRKATVEAERRDAEMESGKVKGIPGQQVFDCIESRHKKKK